jgi:hypothetical protein
LSIGVAVVTPWCGIENGRVSAISAGAWGGIPEAAGEVPARPGDGVEVVGRGAVVARAMTGLALGVALTADPGAVVIVAGASTGAADDGNASHPPTATTANASAMTGRRPGRITRG